VDICPALGTAVGVYAVGGGDVVDAVSACGTDHRGEFAHQLGVGLRPVPHGPFGGAPVTFGLHASVGRRASLTLGLPQPQIPPFRRLTARDPEDRCEFAPAHASAPGRRDELRFPCGEFLPYRPQGLERAEEFADVDPIRTVGAGVATATTGIAVAVTI